MFENDYTINGKHATYLKFLAAKNSGAKDLMSEAPGEASLQQLRELHLKSTVQPHHKN